MRGSKVQGRSYGSSSSMSLKEPPYSKGLRSSSTPRLGGAARPGGTRTEARTGGYSRSRSLPTTDLGGRRSYGSRVNISELNEGPTSPIPSSTRGLLNASKGPREVTGGEWKRSRSASGREYYWNTKTKETRWTDPENKGLGKHNAAPPALSSTKLINKSSNSSSHLLTSDFQRLGTYHSPLVSSYPKGARPTSPTAISDSISPQNSPPTTHFKSIRADEGNGTTTPDSLRNEVDMGTRRPQGPSIVPDKGHISRSPTSRKGKSPVISSISTPHTARTSSLKGPSAARREKHPSPVTSAAAVRPESPAESAGSSSLNGYRRSRTHTHISSGLNSIAELRPQKSPRISGSTVGSTRPSSAASGEVKKPTRANSLGHRTAHSPSATRTTSSHGRAHSRDTKRPPRAESARGLDRVSRTMSVGIEPRTRGTSTPRQGRTSTPTGRKPTPASRSSSLKKVAKPPPIPDDPQYRENGYLAVSRGDVLNKKYKLLEMLGKGQSSTVWLAVDTTVPPDHVHAFVALKITQCSETVRSSSLHEVALMYHITNHSTLLEKDQELHTALLIGHFEHRGLYGIHVVMVFEVLGPTLDVLMAKTDFRGLGNMKLIKDITRSILLGLEDLESMNVVHTDLKPENIMFRKPSAPTRELMHKYHHPNSTCHISESLDDEREVKIADFGLSYLLRFPSDVDKQGRPLTNAHRRLIHASNYTKGVLIQTREYRAPEIILGNDFYPETDMWSLACIVYELITGQYLFDPKSHPEVHDEASMDVEHLAEMQAVMGPPSDKVRNGDGVFISNFFKDGELQVPHRERPAIRDIIYQSMPQDVADKEKESGLIADFLVKALTWCPSDRCKASESLKHPWLAEDNYLENS